MASGRAGTGYGGAGMYRREGAEASGGAAGGVGRVGVGASGAAASARHKRKRLSEFADEEEGYIPDSVQGVVEDDSENEANLRDRKPQPWMKRSRYIPELSKKEFPLQVGHEERPLWILPEDPHRRDKTVGGRIILESFSPYYQASCEFMVRCQARVTASHARMETDS